MNKANLYLSSEPINQLNDAEFIEQGRRITETLKELYPSALSKLTSRILREFNICLFENSADYNDFYKALKHHRFHAKNGSAFPPSASDLLNIILKNRPSGSKPASNNNRYIKEFAYTVKTRGWDEAIREFKTDYVTREWLSTINTSFPYSCFTKSYQAYLSIFHSGDVVGATQHYHDNAVAKDKSLIKKELERAKVMGNSRLKSHYYVFSKKNSKKGTVRDVVKSTNHVNNRFIKSKEGGASVFREELSNAV
tara:strand:+ start:1187 stop:1945 length:759 start_codon:yes stop_codon:yes gene_type:complete